MAVPNANKDQSEPARGNRLERELVDTTSGAIRYLEHGFPNPLVRWHYHDEYELHYIVTSAGKAFIGDYIGQFQPGSLFLVGPRLPHNWISNLDRAEDFPLRDMVVQFGHEPMEKAAQFFPELRELMPLLEQAQYAIEFQGIKTDPAFYMQNIRDSSGAMRLGWFCQFLHELASYVDYKALSSTRIDSKIDRIGQDKVNTVVDYVMNHYKSSITMHQLAKLVGMNQSYFSRFFRKATGNTINEFLTRVRISKACELLTATDRQITSICYDVGYNNVANFNRRFLKHKQMTPREYRNQAQHRLMRGGTKG